MPLSRSSVSESSPPSSSLAASIISSGFIIALSSISGAVVDDLVAAYQPGDYRCHLAGDLVVGMVEGQDQSRQSP